MSLVPELKPYIYFPISLSYDPITDKKRVVPVPKWNLLKKAVPITAGHSVGLLTGSKNGFTVIDVDTDDRGKEIFDMICNQNDNDVYDTPIVKTVHKGLHFYFQYDLTLTTSSKVVKLINDDNTITKIGIDIRNDDGFVICPPTQSYKWRNSLDEFELMKMPEWLLKFLSNPIKIIDDTVHFASKLDLIKNNIQFGKTDEINPIGMCQNAPNIDDIERILDGFKIERCDNYETWIEVCLAVGGIGTQYNIDVFDILNEWSKKSSKYTSYSIKTIEDCIKNSRGSMTMGTLWFWLKQDNEELFTSLVKSIKEENIQEYYYDDYTKLIDMNVKDGFLDTSLVEDYIKSAYVKVHCGGRPVYYTKSLDKNDEVIWTIMLRHPALACIFSYTDCDKKDILFSNIFYGMERTNRLTTYSTVDYMPYLKDEDKPNGRIFNLWKGFPHKYYRDYTAEMLSADKIVIKPFINHIKTFLFPEKQCRKYYKNTIAHLLQKPWDKPESMIVLIGRLGIGKDLVNYDLLSKVIGDSNILRIGTLEELLKQFNKQQAGVLLVIIGELRDKENSQVNYEKLKSEITNKTMNIEPKGVDPYKVSDHRRFIDHGNHGNCVHIDPHDRRLVAFRSPVFPPSREYFNNLYSLVKNPDVAKAFFNVFTHRDISEFDPRVLPITDFKRELQNNSHHNVFRYIISIVQKMVDDDKDTHDISTDDLFDKYQTWANANRENKPSNKKNFVLKIKELGLNENRIRTDFGGRKNMITLNRDALVNTIQHDLQYEFAVDE